MLSLYIHHSYTIRIWSDIFSDSVETKRPSCRPSWMFVRETKYQSGNIRPFPNHIIDFTPPKNMIFFISTQSLSDMLCTTHEKKLTSSIHLELRCPKNPGFNRAKARTEADQIYSSFLPFHCPPKPLVHTYL